MFSSLVLLSECCGAHNIVEIDAENLLPNRLLWILNPKCCDCDTAFATPKLQAVTMSCCNNEHRGTQGNLHRGSVSHNKSHKG